LLEFVSVEGFKKIVAENGPSMMAAMTVFYTITTLLLLQGVKFGA